jgi:MFS family permease
LTSLRYFAAKVPGAGRVAKEAPFGRSQRSAYGDYTFLHGESLDSVRSPAFGRRERRRHRFSIAVIFFLVGFTCATWASRVPSIKDNLDLSNGQLALALFGFSFGIVVTPLIVGRLVVRLGSRTILIISLVCYFAALPLVALAPALALLITAMLLLAIGNCGADVAMNTQGCLVERIYSRPILSSFHAMFSLGTLAGACIGALAASSHTSNSIHFTTAAVMMFSVAATAMTGLLPDFPRKNDVPAGGSRTQLGVPTSPLLLPGAVCFCAMLAESIMNSWSALYFRDIVDSGGGAAAIGFTAFSFGMVVGRLSADRIHHRLGTGRFLLGCSGTASIGTALMLSAGSYAICLIGVVILGLGLSAVVPVVFSYSAGRDSERSGSAIAKVTNIGYAGFFTGPLIMGGLAQGIGLHSSMAILLVLMLVMTVLANRLRFHVARAGYPDHIPQKLISSELRRTASSVDGVLSADIRSHRGQLLADGSTG